MITVTKTSKRLHAEGQQMKRTKLAIGLLIVLLLGLLSACGGGSSKGSGSAGGGSENGGEQVVLKLSHQWPKATTEEGDFRSVLGEKFAAEVEARTNGAVKIQQYPAQSLVKANDQYDAMQKGALDMAILPFDYYSGKIPEFAITLMPALVKNHEQAKAWETAKIGQMIEEIADENNLKILVWIWNAGIIATKGDPIVSPSDVRDGMQFRAAGSSVEEMMAAAGAGIASMPSSEIYSALQTNILDGAITSNSSAASYKLYEQVDSYTTSTENTFWFMFMPLTISKTSWDKLTPEQQKVVEEVAAELQTWTYEASEQDDIDATELFREQGVNVVDMDDAAYEEWVKFAEPVWEAFAEKVEGGAELLEAAKEVQQQ